MLYLPLARFPPIFLGGVIRSLVFSCGLSFGLISVKGPRIITSTHISISFTFPFLYRASEAKTLDAFIIDIKLAAQINGEVVDQELREY